MKKTINMYRILMRKPFKKYSLERLRRRWEYNIKINIMEIICEEGKWTELAHDHV
jgi:hypothetical protein